MQESINKILILGAGGWAYIKYIEDHFIYADITAVDIDPTMIEIAKKELEIETQNIFTDDVLQFTDKLTQKWEKFDLIFAGPPYPLPTLPDIPDLIFEHDLVEGEGWFIMEHNPKHNFKKHPHYVKQKKYGQTIFSIFTNGGKN